MDKAIESKNLHQIGQWLQWSNPCYATKSPYIIGILEGEGIGPEIIRASLSMVHVIEQCTEVRFDLRYGDIIGTEALKKYGVELTPQVIDFCSTIFSEQGAVFCGPGGGRFVYDLRKHFKIYCKIAPIKPLASLTNIGPLKSSSTANIDMLIIRENLGGLYQGSCELKTTGDIQRAIHHFTYDEQQIDSILHVAIRAAQHRQRKLCVITKPGGAPSISALWMARASYLSKDQNIDVHYLEVDNAAYQVIANASNFDVVVAPNLFGDIIADGAALLLGSRGLSYSANFGDQGIAVYQTGHGAAYDLKGQNRANPLGQLLSFAFMLQESFGLTSLASELRAAIQFVLANGWRTSDMMETGCQEVSTSRLAELIADNFRTRLLTANNTQKITPISVPKRQALLLIDLQNDFLDRLPDGLMKRDLLANTTRLLAFCRDHQIPIAHIHTSSGKEGCESMPHWVENKYGACREGTEGILAPLPLQPKGEERIFYKQFFNAFNHPQLQQWLQTHQIDNVILAGLYLHACVRSTAIEAYERGYKIWIASDAVGSTEPLHAELSRIWLSQRVAHFYSVQNIIQSNTNVSVDTTLIAQAATIADSTWKGWRHVELNERIAFLERWRSSLKQIFPQLLQLIIEEIGKPYRDAEEELNRTMSHFEHTLSLANEGLTKQSTRVCYQSLGCCAIITPWNNPVAIPVSKIAAALLYGNTVVWKPSPLVPNISTMIMETMIQANMPPGVVNLLLGDQETARQLILAREVKAVTMTGSIQSGRSVSALCHMLEKPVQAELGGNNACIILADVALESVVESLALSAFSFAGQRCTAIRRFIVEHAIAEKFEQLMIKAIQSLRIGNPHEQHTQIGPVINKEHLLQIQHAITTAVAQGAKIVCGGKVPQGLSHGCWWEPTLLSGIAEHFNIVSEETFGPIAIIQTAIDYKDAVRLANHGPHGLLASMLTKNQIALDYFKSHIEAGILKLTPLPLAIQPDLPFGGWKASRQGPPEHGQWDQQFYTRPQAIYE